MGKPIDLSGEVGLIDSMGTGKKKNLKSAKHTFFVLVRSRLFAGSMRSEERNYIIKAKSHGEAAVLAETAHKSEYEDWYIFSIKAEGGWPYTPWMARVTERAKPKLDSVAGRSTRKSASTATRRRSS